MLLISVDGGTTNTRLVLIRDGVVLAGRRLSLGLRDQLGREKASYGDVLSLGIRELLEENCLREADVDAVTVSGMICAPGGLYALPHIAAPVGLHELAAAMVPIRFPGIADLPFYLIPGVKTFTVPTDLGEMDIMRGEETELCGVLGRMNLSGSATLVLPGSHCKVIPVEADGTLRTFVTTVSGELIRAAAEHTILREGIRDAYPKTLDPEKLLLGFDTAREFGLTEALFKVRILQNFRGYTPEDLFAVLCGAILSEDIRVIEQCRRGRVLVGGSDPFRSAFARLLSERTDCAAEVLPEEIARYAVAYGAERLMRERLGNESQK